MKKIYADFNNIDPSYNIELDCVGSLEDINRLADPLSDGERVLLYVPDDFEVEANVFYDKIWRASRI